MNNRIVIVEDEKSIRDMICFALEKEGFEIFEAENFYDLAVIIQKSQPSLILLDWMLPGLNGLEIIKRLKSKQETKRLPIIMLTAKAEENSKVLGLNSGADDYIVKPFSPRELIARIRALLRRLEIEEKNELRIQDLILNLDEHSVYVNDVLIRLTAQEFRLLAFLMANKNRIFAREQLLDRVWRETHTVNDRTVDSQIRRLRSSLKRFGYDHLIHTVHGVGYKLIDPT